MVIRCKQVLLLFRNSIAYFWMSENKHVLPTLNFLRVCQRFIVKNIDTIIFWHV